MSESTSVPAAPAGPDAVMPGAGRDAAMPAADITPDRPLVRQGRRQRRTVQRNEDGSLQVGTSVSGGGWSHLLPKPLARWLEQDGTVLTWRLLPVGDGFRAWRLCLAGPGEDDVRWQDDARGLPMELPPAAPHPYGGPRLGPGGRLRHQSLTSLSGTHTLVHQDDGNLVLYCAPAHRAIWATNTWWAGEGWADLSEDGELAVRTVRGAPVWRSGTAGRGVRELVVEDDGTVALRDGDGATVWSVPAHDDCPGGTRPVARGWVLRRGGTLERQSLTADDGTVLAHRDDRRLVLSGPDGRWLWDHYCAAADRSRLVLDDDGMLRLRTDDGDIAEELAGPGEELAVRSGEVVLLDGAGTVVWRNGKVVGGDRADDWGSWMDALMDDTAYCATIVHDTKPEEALERLGATPEQITTGTWSDLRTRAEIEEAGFEDGVIAAFALRAHTLLVEDNGWAGVNAPEVSAGTFAVSCYRSVNAASTFVVYRDGAVVADHSWDSGSAEPTTPEVRGALAAMGSDDVLDTALERDLELLCRIAGVLPTVADVTGPALLAIVPGLGLRSGRFRSGRF